MFKEKLLFINWFFVWFIFLGIDGVESFGVFFLLIVVDMVEEDLEYFGNMVYVVKFINLKFVNILVFLKYE